MKRIVYLIIVVIVILGIYHDLSGGTLSDDPTVPTRSTTNTSQPKEIPEPKSPMYQEVIIEPGQTVLSIVEHLHEGQINESIDTIINDFTKLNEEVNPNALQVGQMYRFPLYTP
ncbi:hypothetical protein [Bacillus sp. JCM 19041]|uniref:hypothetical protein n=1 Tax=Bacillus sp. JCM 19041 TaxID=1460637 RepID=UPI0006CF8824